MRFRFSKSIIIGVLSLALLASTGFQSVHAVDKSRVFIWFLFVSGLGSSAAGTIIQSRANETYDMYLHTAIQAEMNEHIDDYDRKHRQSVIASRTGLGLVMGAILLSLVDMPSTESQETPALFGSKPVFPDNQIKAITTRNGDILLAIGRRF